MDQKKIKNMLSAEFAHRVVKVKILMFIVCCCSSVVQVKQVEVKLPGIVLLHDYLQIFTIEVN